MKILRLEAWVVEMELEVPYEVAYTRYDTAANVFLRLVTDGPQVGLGCAGPSEHVTGEDPPGVLRALREVVAPQLEGADATRLAPILGELERSLSDRPATRAAVDLALHDLLAKRAQLALWRLLGGFRQSFPIHMMVGILPEDETVAEAVEYVRRGFRSLKLKGGHDVEGDLQRAGAVRAAVGADVDLGFDANQGYSVDEAVRFLQGSRDLALTFLEQPTPQDQPAQLAEVAARVPGAPLMADECLMTRADAAALAGAGGTRLFNLKLMRLGGLAVSREVLAVGHAHGVDVMVGCMDESQLAIAAGLALALSHPRVTLADLDGHIGLGGDPAVGAVRLEEGVLFPAEEPGLGLRDLAS